MSPVRIYPEYLHLLRALAEGEGVATGDQQALFSEFEPLEPLQSRPADFSLQLTVDDPHFPFERRASSKIYELVGQNLRNKTTTLLFLATLFGADWDRLRTFLQDEKIYRQSQLIQRDMESGLSAAVIAEDEAYRVEISIRNSEAGVVAYDRKNEKYLRRRSGIKLAGPSDWAEFRRTVAGLVDPQIVATGRNFIAQVGFEESENLTSACQALFDAAAALGQKIGAHAPMPKTIAELRYQNAKKRLADLKQGLSALGQELSRLKAQIDSWKQLLDIATGLIAIERVEVSTRLRKRAHDFATLSMLKSSLQAEVDKKEQDLAGLRKAYEGLRNLRSTVEELSQELSREVNSLRPAIPYLQEKVDKLQTYLQEDDIFGALQLMMDPDINESTVDAHQRLANPEIWEGLSVHTPLLGISILGQETHSAEQFRLMMLEASEVSHQVVMLQELATQKQERLNAAGLSMETRKSEMDENLQVLVSASEKLGADLAADKSALGTATSRLKALGVTDYQALVDECESAYQRLSEDEKTALTKLESEGVQLDQWESGERERLISGAAESELSAQRLEAEMDERRSSIIDAERDIARWAGILKKSEEAPHIERRINSLRTLQEKAKAIREFFEYRRSFLDTKSEKDHKHYTANVDTLGPFFKQVMCTINERIRTRCPFAFVNHRESGVKRESVVAVDFDAGTLAVENVVPRAALHGGLNSGLIICGLASKQSTSLLGSVLLVDEYGDVAVYREHIYRELVKLPNLRLGIFVRVLENHPDVEFSAWEDARGV